MNILRLRDNNITLKEKCVGTSSSKYKSPGTWYLDPGLIKKANYNMDPKHNRGGFQIHLPGSRSNGCITAPKDGNSEMGALASILANDGGGNSLEVTE